MIIKSTHMKKLALLAIATVLTACATATPYQAAQNESARNGYSETQIESDRVRVSFDGNSLTKRETVETYLLYRAAELTKEKGFDYFTLADRVTDKNIRQRYSGYRSPYYGYFDYSYYSPYRGWSNPYYRPYYAYHGYRRGGFGYSQFGSSYGGYGYGHDGFGYDEITRYRATAEVKFGKGQKPADADNAFNAQEVLENLGKEIVYPEVKT
jgi:hypothetical protein